MNDSQRGMSSIEAEASSDVNDAKVTGVSKIHCSALWQGLAVMTMILRRQRLPIEPQVYFIKR